MTGSDDNAPDLRAPLLALRRHDLDDGPCWCSTEPSKVNEWRHVAACREARAAPATPSSEPSVEPGLRDVYQAVEALPAVVPDHSHGGVPPPYLRRTTVLDTIARLAAHHPPETTGDLPTAADLRGLAPGVTGGLGSAEYVRRLRDETTGDLPE